MIFRQALTDPQWFTTMKQEFEDLVPFFHDGQALGCKRIFQIKENVMVLSVGKKFAK